MHRRRSGTRAARAWWWGGWYGTVENTVSVGLHLTGEADETVEHLRELRESRARRRACRGGGEGRGCQPHDTKHNQVN